VVKGFLSCSSEHNNHYTTNAMAKEGKEDKYKYWSCKDQNIVFVLLNPMSLPCIQSLSLHVELLVKNVKQ